VGDGELSASRSQAATLTAQSVGERSQSLFGLAQPGLNRAELALDEGGNNAGPLESADHVWMDP